ncbi:MAG: hypothetical protein A2X18_03345 [Bacteroidetes bacterium GWF2_40_14]|nr:MAG: hypothetical protein A2X18_03345 [Bacteroidetes bacterium GWF2_40_14]
MQQVRNIIFSGLLVMVTGILLISPYLNISDFSDDCYSYNNESSIFASQYEFSNGSLPNGGAAILNSGFGGSSQAEVTTISIFSAYMLEKILSYSYLRERILSRASLKPFLLYFVHSSKTPGNYFVYVLREIII